MSIGPKSLNAGALRSRESVLLIMGGASLDPRADSGLLPSLFGLNLLLRPKVLLAVDKASIMINDLAIGFMTGFSTIPRTFRTDQ